MTPAKLPEILVIYLGGVVAGEVSDRYISVTVARDPPLCFPAGVFRVIVISPFGVAGGLPFQDKLERFIEVGHGTRINPK